MIVNNNGRITTKENCYVSIQILRRCDCDSMMKNWFNVCGDADLKRFVVCDNCGRALEITITTTVKDVSKPPQEVYY